MSEYNQRFSEAQTYQVWATSWTEDGSEEAVAAEKACTRYHAQVRLIGQCNDIAKAVRIFEDNRAYEPRITRVVTWKTEITDVTRIDS